MTSLWCVFRVDSPWLLVPCIDIRMWTSRTHRCAVLPPLAQAWEKCVDKHRDAGDDFVEACVPFTHGLKECMEANSDYYGALLVRGSLELQGAK